MTIATKSSLGAMKAAEGIVQTHDSELEAERDRLREVNAALRETVGDILGLLNAANEQTMYGREMDVAIQDAIKLAKKALAKETSRAAL